MKKTILVVALVCSRSLVRATGGARAHREFRDDSRSGG